MKINLVLIASLLFLCGCFIVGGADAYITEEQYQSIERGMSKEQVFNRLGVSSVEYEESGWHYQIKHGDSLDHVTILFNSSEVVDYVGKP